MKKNGSIVLLCISLLLLVCMVFVVFWGKAELDDLDEWRKNHDHADDGLPGACVLAYAFSALGIYLAGGLMEFSLSVAGSIMSGINMKRSPVIAIKRVSVGLFALYTLLAAALVSLGIYYWVATLI